MTTNTLVIVCYFSHVNLLFFKCTVFLNQNYELQFSCNVNNLQCTIVLLRDVFHIGLVIDPRAAVLA
jgi:hypothetical protein